MKNRKLYFFKCPRCGEYRTTAQTFKKFCPDKEWGEIQMRKDSAGGRIDFETGCPKCLATGESRTKIILLKPKRTLN